MLIFEIFDSPYQLVTNTPFSQMVYNYILKNVPDIDNRLSSIEIYHEPIKQNPPEGTIILNRDPINVFILEKHLDGVWEGHHILWVRDTLAFHKTRSGERLNLKSGPSPRYISTLISLLRPKLEAGEPIRIVASKKYQFWEVYKRLIERMLKRSSGKYTVDPVDDNYRTLDGESRISQIIRPANKSN